MEQPHYLRDELSLKRKKVEEIAKELAFYREELEKAQSKAAYLNHHIQTTKEIIKGLEDGSLNPVWKP